MKKCLCMLIAAMLLFYCFGGLGEEYYVVHNPNPQDRLNLRIFPDKASDSLGRYNNGVIVRKIRDVNREWMQVQIGNASAYMMKEYLCDFYPSQGNAVRDAQIISPYKAHQELLDGPGMDGELIADLPEGVQVQVLGVTGACAHVQTSGTDGYVPLHTVSYPDQPVEKKTFYAYKDSNALEYDLFVIRKMHTDEQNRVYAVSGTFEKLIDDEECGRMIAAENGKMFTLSLSNDFQAEMLKSNGLLPIYNVPVKDLYQWYLCSYLDGSVPERGKLIYEWDEPEGNFDFWFVTTQVFLNAEQEIAYMEFFYVPWM